MEWRLGKKEDRILTNKNNCYLPQGRKSFIQSCRHWNRSQVNLQTFVVSTNDLYRPLGRRAVPAANRSKKPSPMSLSWGQCFNTQCGNSPVDDLWKLFSTNRLLVSHSDDLDLNVDCRVWRHWSVSVSSRPMEKGAILRLGNRVPQKNRILFRN